jgi:hypothetical protein
MGVISVKNGVLKRENGDEMDEWEKKDEKENKIVVLCRLPHVQYSKPSFLLRCLALQTIPQLHAMISQIVVLDCDGSGMFRRNPEDEGTMYIRNIDCQLQHCAVSYNPQYHNLQVLWSLL